MFLCTNNRKLGVLMLKHSPERVHRKVLRKAKKHFVTVTLAGGLVAALGAQSVSANEGEAVVPGVDETVTGDVGDPVDEPVVDDVDGGEVETPTVDDVDSGEVETPTVDDVDTGDAESPVDTNEGDTDTDDSDISDDTTLENDGEVAPLAIPETPERPEGTRRATIIHTNDIHGRIHRGGESEFDLGLGYIKSIADAYRELSDEVILLDAGDAVHGTTAVNLSEGENMIRLLNALGYKALSPGNHEFNYGYEQLLALEELADFDFIASNIEDENGNQLFDTFTEWQIFGESIGIIGVGSRDTTTTTHPNNIEGISFTDETEAVQAQIDELSDQFSKFILLSHAGFGVDEDIARNIPELELIIGGHSHTPVIGGSYVDGNDNTLIAQAWEHSKLVGVVHLDFDDEGNIVNKTSQVITLADNFDAILESLPGSTVGNVDDILRFEGEEDPEIAAMLEDMLAELDEELSEIIGSSDVHLDGERANVRTGESNLGNLITDAVRDFTGADVAFMNGGGIRDSIEAGDITLGDVMTVLPFINLVETVNIPGSVLLEALEHGMRLYPEQNGALLHVSGMKYIVDATLEPGSRIVYAEVNGVELDPDQVYSVATNDFLIAGGDGFEMLTDYEPDLITGELFSDVLIQYIINQEGPISPELEDRITISDETLSDEALAELIAAITDAEDDDNDSEEPIVEEEIEDEDDVDEDDGLTPEQQEIYDYLRDVLGEEALHQLLDILTLEELMALVQQYEDEADSIDEVVESILESEAQKHESDEERLPDTATASWLIGLVGVVSLTGGLALTKKD